MKILIKNARIVTEDALLPADVLVENSRIERIGASIEETADEVIDAEGKTLLPGFVDMHCHLREPGFEHKETIATGTQAALQGGFTSVACMPNTDPVIDNAVIVQFVKDRAFEVDNVKVYPIGAITKGQKGTELSEMAKMKQAGIIAVSDDGRPVADSSMMKKALEYAKSHDILVISHCEDLSLSQEGVVNEGFHATVAGLKGISRVAEESMIAREILLAEALDTRVHIAHVSTRNGVALIRSAKKRGVRVTAETCPHYFSASDDEILAYNTNAKINPPLREESDVAAVIEGLKDGTIDVIATDHAPHHKDDKSVAFDLAAFGTSGFETAFAIAYTYLVEPGHIDIIELCKLMSTNPARILGLNTGAIKEGATADLVLADLEKSYTIDASKFVSKGKNSLFNGWKVTGEVTAVLVDGIIKEIKHYDR